MKKQSKRILGCLITLAVITLVISCETTPKPQPKPVKIIQDSDPFRYLEKVRELPTEPVSGECQLVRAQDDNGKWQPRCVGSCPDSGRCGLKTGTENGVTFARCDCD